ncbi:MAG TPA: hypothetical protein VGO43_06405 [Pyrinomonadaceae bacterium]|jgi:hypothetical protein|nr:hypothetical protein [Pyrinomonadaceae bacterium]
MEYDLITTRADGYLYARVRAIAITPAITIRLLREVKNELTAARNGRLLLECEIAHALDESEAFALTGELLRMMHGLRIAFVNRDTRHFRAFNLSVGLAVSTGEDHRFFADPSTAREWLLRE